MSFRQIESAMARYFLGCDQAGYYLKDTCSRQKPLRANFDEPGFMARLSRAGRKNELVARAVKAREGLRVLDCTAGLARDSLILARLGCQVTLVERSRVMACLLEDALSRAAQHPLLGPVVERVTFIPADALDLLDSKTVNADVIYLDPMFPERNASARVHGDMQCLQGFLGADDDAGQLLDMALLCQVDRVVLKRPTKGDWLPPVKPLHVFRNRNSRYEVFSPQSQGPSG